MLTRSLQRTAGGAFYSHLLPSGPPPLSFAVRRMHGNIARTVGSVGAFFMSMLVMAFVCIWAWDAFVNGKLYYCTDGGWMDFIFVGHWVHHPESVAHVVPRPMDQPDE